MTIKEKILSYLESTGKVKTEFYKAIGASPSNFKGAGKNSALSSDKISEILILYPDLSPDWLLTGIGEMLRDSNSTGSPVPTTATIPVEDKLLTMLKDCQTTIRLQAEEIGRLRERIKQLEQRLQKFAGDASIETTVNVG